MEDEVIYHIFRKKEMEDEVIYHIFRKKEMEDEVITFISALILRYSHVVNLHAALKRPCLFSRSGLHKYC